MNRPQGTAVIASPLIAMTLASSGFAIGFAFAFRTSNEAFLTPFAGKAWIILIGANVGAWFLLVVPIIQRFLAVETLVRGRRAELGATFCVFGFLYLLPLWPPVVDLIAGFPMAETDIVLPIIGGAVASAAMSGIWRIHAASEQIRSGNDGPGHAPDRVDNYLTLQDHLQAFLWIVGALISLGTLAFGFAIKAIKEVHSPIVDIPDQAFWAYGLYYTTLLALSYVPTYIGLITTGRFIRDSVIGGAPFGPTEVEGWLRRRDELTGLLQISQGPVARLKGAIFVVSPLLASVLSTLFEKSV